MSKRFFKYDKLKVNKIATAAKSKILSIAPDLLRNRRKEKQVSGFSLSSRFFIPITAIIDRNGKTGRIYLTCFAVRKYAIIIKKTENSINRNLSFLFSLLSKIKGKNRIRIGFRTP